jgi:hypothetical protein
MVFDMSVNPQNGEVDIFFAVGFTTQGFNHLLSALAKSKLWVVANKAFMIFEKKYYDLLVELAILLLKLFPILFLTLRHANYRNGCPPTSGHQDPEPYAASDPQSHFATSRSAAAVAHGVGQDRGVFVAFAVVVFTNRQRGAVLGVGALARVGVAAGASLEKDEHRL